MNSKVSTEPSEKGGDLLTLQEVAKDLRCSKAHVSNLINGKVKHAPRLPVIRMGRRKLVRRETLELWKLACERGVEIDDMIRSSGSSVPETHEKEFHA